MQNLQIQKQTHGKLVTLEILAIGFIGTEKLNKPIVLYDT